MNRFPRLGGMGDMRSAMYGPRPVGPPIGQGSRERGNTLPFSQANEKLPPVLSKPLQGGAFGGAIPAPPTGGGGAMEVDPSSKPGYGFGGMSPPQWDGGGGMPAPQMPPQQFGPQGGQPTSQQFAPGGMQGGQFGGGMQDSRGGFGSQGGANNALAQLMQMRGGRRP